MNEVKWKFSESFKLKKVDLAVRNLQPCQSIVKIGEQNCEVSQKTSTRIWRCFAWRVSLEESSLQVTLSQSRYFNKYFPTLRSQPSEPY